MKLATGSLIVPRCATGIHVLRIPDGFCTAQYHFSLDGIQQWRIVDNYPEVDGFVRANKGERDETRVRPVTTTDAGAAKPVPYHKEVSGRHGWFRTQFPYIMPHTTVARSTPLYFTN